MEKLQFFVGQLGQTDKFVAVSDVEPRFCFEAQTKDEVIKKALDGWEFYLRVKGKTLKPHVHHTTDLDSLTSFFVPKEFITARAS